MAELLILWSSAVLPFISNYMFQILLSKRVPYHEFQIPLKAAKQAGYSGTGRYLKVFR
ncbi:hypothetical protein [uncultured Robinsoniella sp.]|uniref:hypothetical protein n=1 Tax=uncultured Robinsoniella sp. TaxID=904190 RepID=UPI00374F94B9